MELDGRRIVVTGGYGALGSAVARAALAAGARVAVVGRSGPTGPEGLKGAVLRPGVDLADVSAAEAAMQALAAELGGIDGLVNVAGTFRWETLAEGSVETWDLLYRTNLRTAVVASQAALPWLRESAAGRIVNVGAAAAARAGAGMGAYAASKSGVARLTEALAAELIESAITVNAVLPSILDTPANRADMPDADFGTWVHPDALAGIVCFLLGGRAAAITGALLPVTGRT